ncbi:MAG: phosphocholine cytidylyltransferase family protein [Selenomonadaceae bacterium]|nr:phosphocholine cytidylyltransferase family protein [Selenomonadaceae bacterium]
MSNGKPAHAVILAAGMGTRLRPLTAELPKPMVPVCGRPIITTILDGLRLANISDVYVICGWQKEKLFALKATYPEVQFLENPDFATANNISSILVAGELLQDALVIEGDLYFHHPAVFQRIGTVSNYLAFSVPASNDWCFFTDDEHRITRMAVGSDGEPCWQMVGCSYWTAEDGRRLLAHAREVYDAPGGHARYWDEIALDAHLGEYDIRVRPCEADDVIEIDTVDELYALERKLK